MTMTIINPELATTKPTLTHKTPGSCKTETEVQKGLRTTTNTRAGAGKLPAWLTDSPTSCPINRGDFLAG